MNRWLSPLVAVLLFWLAFPQRCPAPITYIPGVGVHIGDTSWIRDSSPEQYKVAEKAFEAKDYTTALMAANYIVKHPRWRLGDDAAKAYYLMGRCYEAKGNDERAFKSYQKLIETFPNVVNYEEVVKRQFLIANRYLAGKFWRVFGYIPLYPSMDKTVTLYEQIVKNGPYSEVAPPAQMNIGLAHENKRGLFVRMPDYPKAAKAYGLAAERYSDQKMGVEALYREAMAYTRQARRAEYDQSIAAQAIATFTQFIALYPEEPRVPEAKRIIESLKTEQARGSFEIAKFYEKKHRWEGAIIYYNDVLLKDQGSKYGTIARQRIDVIKKRMM